MNFLRLSLVAFFASCCVLPIANAALAADAERGAETYLRVGCWQCHGYAAQGASTGPKLAPDPLPMEAIRDYIRVPGDRMPPYREAVLSDEEIADIHAYLETIPPAPNLEDTILGQ
jgi:ubiquinol-cytochrome c reductase cytochrome c subunit